MTQDVENRLATLIGRHAILNEVVIAMLAAMPNRDSVLRLAVRNAQDLRDAAMDAQHAESWLVGVNPGSEDANAWLAGADQEIQSYRALAGRLEKKKGV